MISLDSETFLVPTDCASGAYEKGFGPWTVLCKRLYMFVCVSLRLFVQSGVSKACGSMTKVFAR